MKNILRFKKHKIAAFNTLLFFCVIFIFSLSPQLPAQAQIKQIQENKFFLVDSVYDKNNQAQIKATLKKISSRAYFYIEDNYYNNLSIKSKSEFELNLSSLSKDFDNIIYPNLKKTYGTEWNPGIDNDSRITILLTQTKENIGGYFNPSDEYKKKEVINEKSNEREMLYLNVAFLGNERIKSFLAHEFQHMITWYHKTKLKNIIDKVWLNEARSEYASTAIGYDNNYSNSNLKARIDNFKINPTDSLLEWQNKIYDYSSVNIFSQYLADRFGDEIFKEMINNNKIGTESINQALKDLGYNENFETIFIDWTIANYLNGDLPSLDSKYSYKNTNINYKNFHIIPQDNYKINTKKTISISKIIKDWSSIYYKFDIINNNHQNNEIKIDFEGQNSGKFSVPYIISYKDGTYKINRLNLDSQQDSIMYFSNQKKEISSIAIIPTSHKKSISLGNNADKYSFSISINIVKTKLYKDNSLLKSLSDSKVYLIENGKKRWITNANTFNLNGYKWKDIVIVTTSELDVYPDGSDII